VPEIPAWSNSVVVKSGAVETCNRYDVAVDEALQERVGFTATPVALFAGDASTGAGGGGISVVKLHVADQLPVPVELVALTRQ